MDQSDDRKFIQMAIRLAREGMDRRLGGPFGALVVRDGKVIGKGQNEVTSSFDPTAHAEVVAIRSACKTIGDFQLKGSTVYTSCEPCPMCLGAIYWARPQRIVYACSREDAAEIGFDDQLIYDQIPLAPEERSISATQIERDKGIEVLRHWKSMDDKTEY